MPLRLLALLTTAATLFAASYGEWLMDQPTTPRGEAFIHWSRLSALASSGTLLLVLWATAPTAEAFG